MTSEQRQKFPPLVPDFLIELRSQTDRLKRLQDKTSDPASAKGARECARMQEYIDNGLPLGWLINPQNAEVEIYRSQKAVEVRSMPAIISGESILPSFKLQV